MSAILSLSETKNIVKEIRDNIENKAVNRPVTLIAASKFQSMEHMDTVYKAGVRHFGENRGQEVRDKKAFFLDRDIELSFIGQLQKNKVKYLIGVCSLIQSVDRLPLARYINERYAAEHMNIDILIEVNISEEESKSGFRIEETEKAVKEIKMLDALNIRGLMTIGPLTDNEDKINSSMNAMNQLYCNIKDKYERIDTLSMGMTDDYISALKNGSNMIRIGRKLFGGRH